jgi:hypothetical protein
MTLLIGIIRDNQCVLSGDFRRTNVQDTEEFYDDIGKIYKVNNNILIGYSGDLKVMAKLSTYFDKGVKPNTTLESAARRIKGWVNKNIEPADHLTVLLVGKADNGKPAIFNISHREKYRIKKRSYTGSENINWEFVYANVCPEIESKLSSLGGTIQELEELCRTLNYEVSIVDSWVSNECEVISLEI